jgi:prepilin-type N-terminal cleavage/methylation domain-containing protein
MFKKNSAKKTNKFAFSLIELSIVILVIGILMVGVSQGYNLVRSSQISNARSITAKSPIQQIQGLLAWYETSLKESLNQSEVKDGNIISKWKDISSSSILNGGNQLSSSNVTYAQSAINKIPAIRFNGSSKLSLDKFSQGASSQVTVFLVIKPNYSPDGNFKTIFDKYVDDGSPFSFSLSSTVAKMHCGTERSSSSLTTTLKNSGEYAIALYFNGISSKIFINDAINPSGLITSDIGTNQLVGLTLGASSSSSATGFIGLISEFAIFNRVIKATERKEIFNYFSKKYKIDIEGV